MQSAYDATVLNAWEGYSESLASPDTGQNRWKLIASVELRLRGSWRDVRNWKFLCPLVFRRAFAWL